MKQSLHGSVQMLLEQVLFSGSYLKHGFVQELGSSSPSSRSPGGEGAGGGLGGSFGS